MKLLSMEQLILEIWIVLEISGPVIKGNSWMDNFMVMEYGHLVIIVDFMEYFNLEKYVEEGNLISIIIVLTIQISVLQQEYGIKI